ncbi:hypothetical protein WMY93_023387 [Mugilogobius chulae]|uniref:Uncharacterized protein n=1 Tax=Mugilogobius chulae TaxID=88201 RepID=A0AAW0NB17_9GOBI
MPAVLLPVHIVSGTCWDVTLRPWDPGWDPTSTCTLPHTSAPIRLSFLLFVSQRGSDHISLKASIRQSFVSVEPSFCPAERKDTKHQGAVVGLELWCGQKLEAGG